MIYPRSSIATVARDYQEPPLTFEDNHGQAPHDTRFLARGRDYQIHLGSDSVAVALWSAVGKGPARNVRIVRMRFIGANTHAVSAGEGLLSSKSNYFLDANASQGITDVPNYARVRVEEVYPSIDLVYYGSQGQLEYDLIARPGADINTVKIAIDGADQIRVDSTGELRLSIGSAVALLKRPLVYQEYDGKRHAVPAWFERRGRNELTIRTGPYDRRHVLTIDPILTYGSYLGGSKDDWGQAIAVDGSGSAYVTGYTFSTDFPLLSAYQSSMGKVGEIAFVTKMNASGTGVIYSTYLGDVTTRGGRTQAFGIAVDATGAAYVTGTTTSGFPVTSGAYETTGGSGTPSFVAKLGPAGNTLVYGTFVVGATASAITVDGSGNTYVTGSAVNTYHTTTGAYQTTDKALGTLGTNAFVLKLNPSGSAAVYSTFIGGSYNNGNSLTADGDQGISIAADPSGNAYVGGGALSSDFPVTANAFQSGSSNTFTHGFITKVNPQGSALVYSAKLAGNTAVRVTGLAVDPAGYVYATGETTSSDFPLTASAFKTTMGADGSEFVTKLSADGHSLIYSSYLADENLLTPSQPAIAIDSGGRAFVAGEIASPSGMSLVNDLLPGEPSNAVGMYVVKISALGDAVLYATHIGWSTEAVYGIAVDQNGDAYATATGDFNDVFTDTFLLSSGAFQTTHASSDIRDALVVKLTTGAPLVASLSLSATVVNSGQAITASTTVGYASGGSGSGLSGSVIFYDGLTQVISVPLSSGTATATLTLPVGIHSLAAVYRNNGAEAVSITTYLEVNPPPTCN